MKTWRAKYQDLALAAEIRSQRIEQRDERVFALLHGAHRFLFSVRSEPYSDSTTTAYSLPDGGILMEQGGSISWHDRLADAVSLYQGMESAHSRRVYSALLACATVSRELPDRRSARIAEMLQRFAAA